MGGGVQITNGDCKKLNLIYLLQPYWIMNNVQKWINIQECKCKENGCLFGFFRGKGGFCSNLIN